MLHEFDPDECYEDMDEKLVHYVLERDDRLCLICGNPGTQIHHVIMKSQHHDKYRTPHYANNLILLCDKHHDSQHGKGGGVRRSVVTLQGYIERSEARLREAIS